MTKNLLRIAVAVVLVLLVPLLAMQFTDEVDWGVFDFAAMGVLLFATGVGIDLSLEKLTSMPTKIIAIAVVVGIFLLVWAQLAVGII